MGLDPFCGLASDLLEGGLVDRLAIRIGVYNPLSRDGVGWVCTSLQSLFSCSSLTGRCPRLGLRFLLRSIGIRFQ